MIKICTAFILVLALSSCSAQDCSSYTINAAALKAEPPVPNAKSAIGRVFASLHGELKATMVPQPSGPSCYEWTCQSKDRQGEQCRWCLPSIFVGGIAKCGTTALCDKLVTHPDVRFYKKKETDVFTKLHFSISEFESIVNTPLQTAEASPNADLPVSNKRLLRKAGKKVTGAEDVAAVAVAAPRVKKNESPGRHEGRIWLDCSAGAFRDFNAAAHLRLHSPDTKIVMIVRDPWQTIGSRMAQQIRQGHKPLSVLATITSDFRRLQYLAEHRFDAPALQHLARGTDYAYAEKLLHWRAAFPEPDRMLLLDQYDLQHRPQDTMFRLETFLNLSHANYSHDVLQAVSHNAYSGVKLPAAGASTAFNANTSNYNDSASTTNTDLVIHKPYSFNEHPDFLRLSRNVLHPSLCLFEKVFGWKIHITTASEAGPDKQ